jgi:hypothetical protein
MKLPNRYARVRYRCRCAHCRARRTLGQHPRFYITPPTCPTCGSTAWTVDSYRQSGKEAKRYTCTCPGFPYPHRRGSGSGLFSCEAESAAQQMHREMRADGMISAAPTTNSGDF